MEAAILDKDIIGKSNRYIRFEELEIGLEYKNFDKMEELIYQVKNDQKVKKIKNGRDKFRRKRYAGSCIKKIVMDTLEEI